MKWLLKQGTDLHRRAREYLASFDLDLYPDSKAAEGGARVVLGAFSWTDDEEKEG